MEIKGSILTSRLEYVKQRFGERSVEAVLNSLPNGDQVVLRKSINPAGWYHFQTGQRLDEAIVEVVGRGDAKLFEEMGASSAQQSLSGIQKFYLDPGNPQGFHASRAVDLPRVLRQGMARLQTERPDLRSDDDSSG